VVRAMVRCMYRNIGQPASPAGRGGRGQRPRDPELAGRPQLRRRGSFALQPQPSLAPQEGFDAPPKQETYFQ